MDAPTLSVAVCLCVCVFLHSIQPLTALRTQLYTSSLTPFSSHICTFMKQTDKAPGYAQILHGSYTKQ